MTDYILKFQCTKGEKKSVVTFKYSSEHILENIEDLDVERFKNNFPGTFLYFDKAELLTLEIE